MTAYSLPAVQGSFALAGRTQTPRVLRRTAAASRTLALTGTPAALVYTQTVSAAEQHQFQRFFSTVGSLMTHV